MGLGSPGDTWSQRNPLERRWTCLVRRMSCLKLGATSTFWSLKPQVWISPASRWWAEEMDGGVLEGTNSCRTGVHRFGGCKLQSNF